MVVVGKRKVFRAYFAQQRYGNNVYYRIGIIISSNNPRRDLCWQPSRHWAHRVWWIRTPTEMSPGKIFRDENVPLPENEIRVRDQQNSSNWIFNYILSGVDKKKKYVQQKSKKKFEFGLLEISILRKLMFFFFLNSFEIFRRKKHKSVNSQL